VRVVAGVGRSQRGSVFGGRTGGVRIFGGPPHARRGNRWCLTPSLLADIRPTTRRLLRSTISLACSCVLLVLCNVIIFCWYSICLVFVAIGFHTRRERVNQPRARPRAGGRRGVG